MKPLAIDLFCGLGGWTDGLLAEGYEVIGFDISKYSSKSNSRKAAAAMIAKIPLTLSRHIAAIWKPQ